MSGLGRGFRFLWGSAGASNLADGLLLVGVPLLAVSLTRSPLLISLVSAAATAPWLLLALPAGALADRHDRRTIMILAAWTRAAVLAGAALAAWLGLLDLPLLVAAVLLAGAGEVFADTAAQSVLPATVGRDRLAAANGRLTAVQTLGNHFLGAPLAGVLAALGAYLVFGGAALLYALAALLLLGLRGRFAAGQDTTGARLRDDIRVGLRHLGGHAALRGLAAFTGLSNLANGAYFAVFVLWVVGPGSRVGLTPQTYGLVATTLAVGAVLGSVLAAPLAALAGEARALLAVTTAGAALLLVPLLAPVPAAVFAAAAGIGAANAVTNVVAVSLRQRLIPEHLLGRVNAACRLIGNGAMPIGAAAAGALGTVAGVPAVFWTAAALTAVAAVVVLTQVGPEETAPPRSAPGPRVASAGE
ncbi:enterobactin exporter EntS [Nonomuraea coxensis DSM 45129]|uniref:Enterobactin exporter EntS n=1 Tax=Nonomuraea coxensis DSM 45129 TaxID=1122611 RepID=A0ABX8U1S5_9ACTN|nr:MFS transporter [Nonomuraea coxensis]QYC41613.1 enterobactin exporter EntS [Nonomuraea coxensis DSM 45129]